MRHAGEAFVLATVIRSIKPASARPGDRALLTRDGASQGWVGGGCVQTSIEKEARLALADGAPRLVRLAPEVVPEDGIVSYPMTCHSGGTLEIYLEPVLPAPVLAALGDSPVSDALCALAPPLGFRVVRSLEPSNSDAWVVAAGMSSAEDHPLVREALALGVPYVAMVSSRKRADVLRAELASEGINAEALKAPAGLDIGAATPAEIALSILAEIIQRRRAAQPTPAIADSPSRAVAVDPICNMEVEVATARWTAERNGQTYYFCAPGCRKAFLAR